MISRRNSKTTENTAVSNICIYSAWYLECMSLNLKIIYIDIQKTKHTSIYILKKIRDQKKKHTN